MLQLQRPSALEAPSEPNQRGLGLWLFLPSSAHGLRRAMDAALDPETRRSVWRKAVEGKAVTCDVGCGCAGGCGGVMTGICQCLAQTATDARDCFTSAPDSCPTGKGCEQAKARSGTERDWTHKETC